MKLSRAIILTHTPEPERICAAAARISTTQGTATQIYENTRRDNIGRLISNVIGIGHKTIIEHAAFTIAFENVSAFFEQFLIEFRLAAYTIKSRRYVDFSQMGFYQPEFRFNTDLSDAEKMRIQNQYRQHVEFLFSEYSKFVDDGVPKEDARFILPYCYRSNIYCTVNARELLHMIYAAVHGRGARFPEIRHLGEQLLAQAGQILPDVFEMLEQVEYGSEDKELKLRTLLSGRDAQKRKSGERVELTTFSRRPEEIVAVSAIVCHSGCDTSEAEKLIEERPDIFQSVLDIVTGDRRRRELEQAVFTFRINDLSLAGLTHLVRHRIQSILVPSFTEFGKSAAYILPESISNRVDILTHYHEIWRQNRAVFETFSACGMVEEDWVYLYLSGNLLDVVATMNGRQLYHFLRLRTCNRAQWEIRNIAVDMLKKLRRAAPKLFANAGPACFTDGRCPEGKLSCGRIKDVQTFFDPQSETWKN